MEEIAAGVWLLRGDLRKAMNVYFIADGDGVVQYDAATRTMRRPVRRAGEQLGGVKRVILGHAHADHRGTATATGAPIYCHPDEVADAERDDAIDDYFDLSQLPVGWVRRLYPALLWLWDGGGVPIAGTVAEGDEVAGFRVIDLPGHARGLIGLWRESDRVAVVSDAVYLVDSARLKPLPEGEPSIPHPAWAWNHDLAKESLRKLAALEPKVVAAGHLPPLRGDNLRDVLERAAEKF